MDILSRLQSEFGDAVSPQAAEASDAVDGVQPQAIAAPRDEEAAQALVHWCGRENVAFVPRGGGTKLHIGAPPTRCDLIVSTEKLTEIFDHDVVNGTVRAGAGISIEDLDLEVRESGQFLPLCGDSANELLPSLGGVVAANYFGGDKLKYGTPRDLVTGLHAVFSDGRLVKSGSKVVKNVSGYDLNKLIIGSFGTLGLITEVTVRLRPVSEHVAVWQDVFIIFEEAESLALEILQGPFEPTWLRVEDRGGFYHLSAQFEGGKTAVESQLRRLPRPEVTELIGVPPPGAWRVRAHLTLSNAPIWFFEVDNQKAFHIVWDCALGIVRADYHEQPDGGEIFKLRAAAEKLGGYLIVEKASVEVKTPDLVWGAPRGDFALMKKLKQSFDTANVCAPGRFVGGL